MENLRIDLRWGSRFDPNPSPLLRSSVYLKGHMVSSAQVAMSTWARTSGPTWHCQEENRRNLGKSGDVHDLSCSHFYIYIYTVYHYIYIYIYIYMVVDQNPGTLSEHRNSWNMHVHSPQSPAIQRSMSPPCRGYIPTYGVSNQSVSTSINYIRYI